MSHVTHDFYTQSFLHDQQFLTFFVQGRLLEVKALLMSASGSAFVNFDDILVDLKLTPSVLDIIAPR